MLAFSIAACGAGSRRCHSITWLCCAPPQPPMTRTSSAMPGSPLPPSRQPNVSRMSLQVALRVAVGRSAKPVPHDMLRQCPGRILVHHLFFQFLLEPAATIEPFFEVWRNPLRARTVLIPEEQLPGLPEAAFEKMDPSPDAEFYSRPAVCHPYR